MLRRGFFASKNIDTSMADCGADCNKRKVNLAWGLHR
jgi:hypothetical protein